MPVEPQEFLLLAPEILLAAAGLLLLLVGTIGRGFGQPRVGAASRCVGAGPHRRPSLVRGPRRSVPAAAALILGGTLRARRLRLLLEAAGAARDGADRAARRSASSRRGATAPTEYYSLLLLATAGMLFMASGYTLLTIWIALETMALASYILAGYFKRELRSNEAALKYFILGALSRGILLYGISLLYGATGTVQLGELSRAAGAARARRATSWCRSAGCCWPPASSSRWPRCRSTSGRRTSTWARRRR